MPIDPLMGCASAANTSAIRIRELDKLVEVFELWEKFSGLEKRGTAITWARELMCVSGKCLTPSVI